MNTTFAGFCPRREKGQKREECPISSGLRIYHTSNLGIYACESRAIVSLVESPSD
jgi:hypothetical protein